MLSSEITTTYASDTHLGKATPSPKEDPVKPVLKAAPAVTAASEQLAKQEQLIAFLNGIERFKGNPNFEKMVRERVSFPKDAVLSQKGNTLIITLEPRKFKIKKASVPTKTFAELNHHPDAAYTKRLANIKTNVDTNSTIPQGKDGEIPIQKLSFFGSIGKLTWAALSGGILSVGPRVEITRDETGITFQGGPTVKYYISSSITRMEFGEGQQEDGGLITATAAKSDNYFLKDFDLLLGFFQKA